MKTLELSKYKVELKDALTWLDDQKLKAALIGDLSVGADELKDIQKDPSKMVKIDVAKMLDRNVTLFGMVINRITEIPVDEGAVAKEVTYSEEWLGTLSIEDGEKLNELAQQIANPKE